MADPTRSRLPYFVIPAVAYFFLCLLLFWPVLLPGRLLFGSDFMMFFYPMKKFLREYFLETGTLPLWNPYLMCGMPFLADLQVSAFYPGGFLFYAMDPEKAFGVTVALHVWVAAVGMFLFAVESGFSRPAAFLAGAVYAFNGFALRHIYAGHLTIFQTVAWAPWIWWAFQRSLKRPLPGGWASVSIFTALLLLGGFPQIAFYALLFWLGLAVVHPAADSAVTFPRRIAVFGVTAATGFVLSAIQLIPGLELTSWSTRADGMAYAAATGDSMRWFDFFNLFFSRLFGSPTDQTYWGTVSASYFWEAGCYAGPVAAAALFGFRWKTASRLERYCIVVLGISLFLAMGKYNPLFPFVHALPIFKNFRVPVQILYLSVTALSLLAAGLVDRVYRNESISIVRILGMTVLLIAGVFVFSVFFVVAERFPESYRLHATSEIGRGLAGFILGFGLVAFALIARSAGKIGAGVAAAILCVITAAELYRGGHFLVRPTKTYDLVREEARAIQKFAEEQGGGPYRVSASGPYIFANSTLLIRRHGVRGYNPLVLSHYVRFWLAMWGESQEKDDYITSIPPVQRLYPPAVRLLSVKYAIDRERNQAETFPDALPRAFWIRDAVIAPEDQALLKMSDPAFDPTRRIFLSGKNVAAAATPDTAPAPAVSLDACRFLEFEPDRLKIEVNAPAGGGYLFLSEIYYPGWQATVDGRPADVMRADYLFRSVSVPAGIHVVEMTYAPASFRIGMIVSGVGLFLCAAYAFYGRSLLTSRPE